MRAARSSPAWCFQSRRRCNIRVADDRDRRRRESPDCPSPGTKANKGRGSGPSRLSSARRVGARVQRRKRAVIKVGDGRGFVVRKNPNSKATGSAALFLTPPIDQTGSPATGPAALRVNRRQKLPIVSTTSQRSQWTTKKFLRGTSNKFAGSRRPAEGKIRAREAKRFLRVGADRQPEFRCMVSEGRRMARSPARHRLLRPSRATFGPLRSGRSRRGCGQIGQRNQDHRRIP